MMLLTGCEDIYNADLDEAENLLVVEARIQAGTTGNYVKLYQSVGFYDEEDYPAIHGAEISLIDDEGNVYSFTEGWGGKYYLNSEVNTSCDYKLRITYGETYESEFISVPEIPDIDTVYGEVLKKTMITTDNDGNKELETIKGVQLYTDIKNDDETNYYRFYGRKVLLSTFSYDTVMGTPVTLTKYVWQSLYPEGAYNIAAPAEYSTDRNINKHELEFFRAKNQELLTKDSKERERGWIYLIHQYSIPVSAYRYYETLNKQLEAEGKIFDPVYLQAFGNIKCITNEEKIILGNFEIYNFREHRYFLKISFTGNNFEVRKTEKTEKIPESGIISIYPPDFWEN